MCGECVKNMDNGIKTVELVNKKVKIYTHNMEVYTIQLDKLLQCIRGDHTVHWWGRDDVKRSFCDDDTDEVNDYTPTGACNSTHNPTPKRGRLYRYIWDD